MELIELKDREIIDIASYREFPINHFGVSLTNEEALEFIEKQYRVFGDDDGPFLVIRIPAGRRPIVWTKEKQVNLKFQPAEWDAGGSNGIICWLKEIY